MVDVRRDGCAAGLRGGGQRGLMEAVKKYSDIAVKCN
jgi:hypothetical protein